jgi:hypothetical protein
VVDAVRKMDEVPHCRREVADVRGAAALVVDDRDLLALDT